MKKFEMKNSYHYYEPHIYGKPEYNGFSKRQIDQLSYMVRCLHVGYQWFFNYLHYSSRELDGVKIAFKHSVDISNKLFFGEMLHLKNEYGATYKYKCQFIAENSLNLERVLKYTKYKNNSYIVSELTVDETIESTEYGFRNSLSTIIFFGHWIDYFIHSTVENDIVQINPEVLNEFKNSLEILIKSAIDDGFEIPIKY